MHADWCLVKSPTGSEGAGPVGHRIGQSQTAQVGGKKKEKAGVGGATYWSTCSPVVQYYVIM